MLARYFQDGLLDEDSSIFSRTVAMLAFSEQQHTDDIGSSMVHFNVQVGTAKRAKMSRLCDAEIERCLVMYGKNRFCNDLVTDQTAK